MNKFLTAFTAQPSPWADFSSKLSAKWRLNTTPSEPAPQETNAVTILEHLVSLPTVTGNFEANHEGLDYIEDLLKKRGMHIKRHVRNGVESLIATTRPTKTPTVFLAAHLDVVSAPSELFTLTERDGKYYGRGVLDMKGALAAYLATVQQLENLENYDFGIMVTTDEEIGGFDGAQRLAEEGYIPKVMVLPDGGLNWNMEKSCKGIWFTTLEATGKSNHGSRPWLGENAIEKLMAALQEIRALFPANLASDTNTINIGTITGGKTINIIPASASASIDFRFINQQEMDRLRQEIVAIAERYGLTYTTEVNAKPVINDIANPFLQAYANCTEAMTGKPMEWVISNAGNDGRFFIERGAVCAVAYPEGGNHHSNIEWISKDALSKMQELFTNYLNTVAKTNK